MDNHYSGTVLAYQVNPADGLVYATVEDGPDGRPMILLFDEADLDALNRAHKELLRAGTPEPDPSAVLAILRSASRSDRFVWDRVEYRWDTNVGEWVAWRRVDDGEPGPQPDVTFVTDRTW